MAFGIDDFMGNAGLGLLGGMMNMFGQSQTNKMQQQMMAQQQSFQERMSSTAYQRASQDMTAAGLNPMMMFSSGSAASSPAGAAPSPMVKSGIDSDSLNKSISTAVQSKVAAATIDNLVEQNAMIKAQALTESKRPALVSADTALRGAQRDTERKRPANVEAGTFNTNTDTERMALGFPVARNAARTAENQLSINELARRVLDIGSFAGRKVDDIISPAGNMVNSAARARRAFSDRYHY